MGESREMLEGVTARGKSALGQDGPAVASRLGRLIPRPLAWGKPMNRAGTDPLV